MAVAPEIFVCRLANDLHIAALLPNTEPTGHEWMKLLKLRLKPASQCYISFFLNGRFWLGTAVTGHVSVRPVRPQQQTCER